ncbi:MAG: short-chain dehydrogenase [Deltaproteobacteria bacterium]|jgi:NAD(P)-dependent dehydrogenase (short-subunit alcohol dehydrogenase family)|nr:short-chain dehydrogenase [Deltaproteobacteria bacterium]
MLLRDKTAIVTGIGPGMGRAIALAFAREGARLAIGARNEERLAAVAAEIEAAGGEVIAVPTDISDRPQCQRLVEETVKHFGALDVLVQNAAHGGDFTPAATADPDRWREIMDCNFFGALHLTQFCVPYMKDRGEGRIILINSGAALGPPPAFGAYAASKSALSSLVRSLAVELGADGIRVNGVALGLVDGDSFGAYATMLARSSGRSQEEVLAEVGESLPLGAIPSPEDCAGSIVFLASDLARPITGQNLRVNGGLLRRVPTRAVSGANTVERGSLPTAAPLRADRVGVLRNLSRAWVRRARLGAVPRPARSARDLPAPSSAASGPAPRRPVRHATARARAVSLQG